MSRVAISITEEGEGLGSPMDPRFGRAQRFVVWDTDSDRVMAMLTNHSVNASHGAGPATAQFLGGHGVEAVISGHYGPKAHDALAALGIEMWCAPAGLTAHDALAQHRDGSLTRP